MKLPIYSPVIKILKEGQLDDYIYLLVKNQLKKKPTSVFIFPTGATPLGLYQKLVAGFQKKEISFAKTSIINLDEYYPISRQNPASYFAYMKQNLIDKIDIDPKNWIIPSGEAKNLRSEIKRLKNLIYKKLPADLTILGIGPQKTCHIGFNEKGSILTSTIRYVSLAAQTIKANSRYFKNKNQMPKGAITLGIKEILASKKIILIAKGQQKAWGIKRSLLGKIDSQAPASFLRYHPQVIFLLDKKASKLLR